MVRFDFYKELYYKELDRKKNLDDGLSIPIGIVTALIAWLFYFFNNYYLKDTVNIPWWVDTDYFAAFLTLVISIYFLIVSYFEPGFNKDTYFFTSGYNYRYFGYAKDYEDYFKQTKDETDLEDVLIENFIECTDQNIKLNDRKTKRFLRARTFLVFSLFLSFVLLFYPIFYQSKLQQPDKPQQTKITNTVNVRS